MERGWGRGLTLVRFCHVDFLGERTRLSGHGVFETLGIVLRIEGEAAVRSTGGIGLELGDGLRSSVPRNQCPFSGFQSGFELGVVFGFHGFFGAHLLGALEERLLIFLEHLLHDLGCLCERSLHRFLARADAALDDARVIGQIFGAEFDAHRGAHFDLVERLVAESRLASIDAHGEFARGFFERVGASVDRVQFLVAADRHRKVAGCLEHFGILRGIGSEDREDAGLYRCQLRRQYDAVIVAVHHEDGAKKTRRCAPRLVVGDRLLLVFIEEAHHWFAVGAHQKVLRKNVACAHLERFAVLHHSFDGVGGETAGEAFVFGFFAADDGNGEQILRHVGVELEHLECEFAVACLSREQTVTFLPVEFGRAEECARTLLPAHDAAPLVYEERQIAVTLHAAGARVPIDEQRLGRGTNGVRFGKFIAARLGDDGALGSKSFHVFFLAFEKFLRDEHRKHDVFHTVRLEPFIHERAHICPQLGGEGPERDASRNRGFVIQIRSLSKDVLVPLGEVIRAGSDGGFGHTDVRIAHGGP